MRRLIVGLSGASGAIFGVRLLQMLQGTEVETHLVVSKWAQQTLEHETGLSAKQVRELAAVSYEPGNMGAAISSGSYLTEGMVVLPCSMRTLAAIAYGTGDNLIHRAADVVLKEHRRLVLAVRETPFNDIHLENMLKLSRMGVTILPLTPAFYNRPQTIDEIVDHLVARVLDQFSISTDLAKRWAGMHAKVARLEPKA